MHTQSSHPFEPFPMTLAGYRSACQYLREQGRDVESIEDVKLETDGFTVIQLTNDIRQLKGHYAAFHAEG